MQRVERQWTLSAADLKIFLGCRPLAESRLVAAIAELQRLHAHDGEADLVRKTFSAYATRHQTTSRHARLERRKAGSAVRTQRRAIHGAEGQPTLGAMQRHARIVRVDLRLASTPTMRRIRRSRAAGTPADHTRQFEGRLDPRTTPSPRSNCKRHNSPRHFLPAYLGAMDMKRSMAHSQ